MAKIDYGQVPEIKNPSFKHVRLTRGSRGGIKKYTHQKYIENKNIKNSPCRSQPGFSLVGIDPQTNGWKLLKVYEEW